MFYGDILCPKEAFTPGIDVGLKFLIPYMGYLAENDQKKILIDTGINERFIINGKAWGGFPATGGTSYVQEALDKAGVKPEEIDSVIYTHLHNDHTGASHLFKDSLHIFQQAEWENLLDPLPSQKIRGDFDPETIPVLKKLDCLRVCGDVEVESGIMGYLTPGHTRGSMSFAIDTEEGVYVVTGDTVILRCNIYPKSEKIELMDGEILKITPAPDVYGPAIPTSLVYDHYAWYQSIYRLKLLIKEEKFLLSGHDPSLVNKAFPG